MLPNFDASSWAAIHAMTDVRRYLTDLVPMVTEGGPTCPPHARHQRKVADDMPISSATSRVVMYREVLVGGTAGLPSVLLVSAGVADATVWDQLCTGRRHLSQLAFRM